jgi:hypothetical protein
MGAKKTITNAGTLSRWRTLPAALAVAVVGVTVGAANASAQTRTPTPSVPHTRTGVAAHPPAITAVRTTAPGRLAAQDTITCTPNVQNPHNSTHVPGTVNVVATFSCTAPVTELNVDAALYRNGVLVAESGYNSVTGSSYAQNNAAEPCNNATYQGWGGFYVIFPPGYEPPAGSTSGFGNPAAITC